MTTTTPARPLHRMPPAERRFAALRFKGMNVRVTASAYRGGDDYYEAFGRLDAVARPMSGTVADLLVLTRVNGDDVAISLATIISIEAQQ